MHACMRGCMHACMLASPVWVGSPKGMLSRKEARPQEFLARPMPVQGNPARHASRSSRNSQGYLTPMNRYRSEPNCCNPRNAMGCATCCN